MLCTFYKGKTSLILLTLVDNYSMDVLYHLFRDFESRSLITSWLEYINVQ